MNETAKTFDEIVNNRRSIRIFDTEHQLDEGVVKRSIERAILAPNSSNLQLWEFYRIKSDEAKNAVVPICLNQNAAKTASELVVFVSRPDLWRKRIKANVENLKKTGLKRETITGGSPFDYYEKMLPQLYNTDLPLIRDFAKKIVLLSKGNKPFVQEVMSKDVPVIAQKSVALAAQTFMLSIKAEGYDSCPMEGYDSKKMKKYLKLPAKAEINMVVGVGKGKPEGRYGDRFRIPNEEVIFEL
ncbi:MAG: nitroreductase family protein [Bacteroidetes bacterium]|nr:nitroreductase family protein [Bacteroidota bacterium]MCB9227535.1 nitroreductase family protein [Chitinophagales bacterium]